MVNKRNIATTMLVLTLLMLSIVPVVTADNTPLINFVCSWSYSNLAPSSNNDIEEMDFVVFTAFEPIAVFGSDPINPSYKWFVDGTYVGDGQVLGHNFETSGSKNVDLYVQDDTGRECSENKFILVKAKDMSPIIVTSVTNDGVGKDNYVGKNEITFTAQFDDSANPNADATNYRFDWNFGDGNAKSVIGSNEVKHTFNFANTFNVKVTVSELDKVSPRPSVAGTTSVIVKEDLSLSNAVVATISASQYEGASPLRVYFDAHAKGGDGDYTYTWEVQGRTIETKDFVEVFTNLGYDDKLETVNLYVQDSAGYESSDSTTITVKGVDPVTNESTNVPPTVTLEVSSEHTERNELVTFTARGDDANSDFLIYSWDFGDGKKIASGSNVESHSYKEKGVYLATVTVMDPHMETGSASVIMTVGGIPLPPTPIATASIQKGPAPLAVSFFGDAVDTDSPVTRYEWNFGDGTHSFEQNPLHIYTVPGTYQVELDVVDDEGLRSLSPARLTIEVEVPKNPTQGGSPVVGDINDTTRVKGQVMAPIQVIAAHPFDDKLTFTATGLPSGVSINSENGSITGVPQDLGGHVVVATVTDTRGLSDSTSFVLTIVESLKDDEEDTKKSGQGELRFARARVLEGEHLNVGEMVVTSVKIANDGDADVEDLAVRVTVPQLGLQRSLVIRDLEEEESSVKTFSVDIPKYAPAGEYTLRITVSNDDFRRVIHRTFEIIE
jgi:PKD repeat protein